MRKYLIALLIIALVQTVIPVTQSHAITTKTATTKNQILAGDVITSELTHYCVCRKCCGKTNGITASGVKIKNGMDNPFIVSCNWLPFGTIVEIDGQEYTVSDRGGKGLSKIGRFDVFVPEGHKAALKLGRKKNVEVIIVTIPE